MLPLLFLLTLVLAGAAALTVWAVQANRTRREVLSRAGAGRVSADANLLFGVKGARAPRVKSRLASLVPEWIIPERSSIHLVRAGFDSPWATVIYTAFRIVALVALPMAVVLWKPNVSYSTYVLLIITGVLLGVVLPPMVLAHFEDRHKDRIRRGLPDALDLLLVCVEAGVSLDAAVLRVGREMRQLHPHLAEELLVVNRRMNAGMRREDALHGMFERTGVEEVRALASTMLQSERWGTSIGSVLRIYAQTLRRKRHQAAEKYAAVAASKMVIPLALFILPPLLIVLGGPIVLGLKPILDAFTNR